MAFSLSTWDLALLALIGAGAIWYLFGGKSTTSNASAPVAAAASSTKDSALAEAGRDPVAALEKTGKRIVIFYGSQTGTAEDYATRIAKEIKSRFGLSSLVADLEDYDYETLDKMPEGSAAIFSLATYGEGEPTDNAVPFMEFIKGDNPEWSQGGDLSNLKYVVFSLGNKTYEHFCAVGRQTDDALTKFGAKRIGTAGEGDDDKSMEEDYLSWKDSMFEALAAELNLEEGAGADSPDFTVEETSQTASDAKVFLGELSQRMLSSTRGVYDAKNPYVSPLKTSRELFVGGDRNCVHAEFDITDSGIRYQSGDHVGVWPINPDTQVLRFLKLLDLEDKKDTVVKIVSLDPALAKVPFPTPSTYDAIFRHYLDISAVASRQSIGTFAAFAPTEAAKNLLQRLSSDKDYYHTEVHDKSLKLSEVLMWAAGDDYHVDPHSLNPTKWHIPFDRIVSGVHRLQPRYYSICSSPKLHPNAIHITAVVLKYQPGNSEPVSDGKYVYGVGTNYLLNLKRISNNEHGDSDLRTQASPVYRIEGPRGRFKKNEQFCAPIHVRRSNFRLPTSPKIPIVMVGPGSGVAPFRGFVQERVVLAQKAIEKDGPDALKDWGTIALFYGCRRDEWDFLYKEEWEEYKKVLGDKFQLFVAYSRQPGKPKTYVQNLMQQNEPLLRESIVEKKGYIYICGDAKAMAHDVEQVLKDIIGRAKGGSKEVEGEQEWKVMKDRNRILLDVWS